MVTTDRLERVIAGAGWGLRRKDDYYADTGNVGGARFNGERMIILDANVEPVMLMLGYESTEAHVLVHELVHVLWSTFFDSEYEFMVDYWSNRCSHEVVTDLAAWAVLGSRGSVRYVGEYLDGLVLSAEDVAWLADMFASMVECLTLED